MSCDRFETWIALYVEDDLPERKVRRLEQHLAECGCCRELTRALRESQAALGEVRDEAPEAAVLGQIRSRVLGEIAASERLPGRRFAWPWTYAATAALVAMIAVAGLWRSAHQEPRKQQVAAVAPKPGSPAPSAPVAPPPARRSVAHARKPARPVLPAAAPRASEPLVVKLVTDDPNVVIIWIVDRNGD